MGETPGRLGIIVTVVAVALCAVVVLTVPVLRDAMGNALHGDTDQLREDLHDHSAGVLILIAVILAHAVVWYPAEIANAAAGVVYGFWPAMLIVLPAWLAANIGAYYIGREAGRPLLHKLAGKERFERLERAIRRGGLPVLLAARLIPVMPMSIVGYVCGAARVPLFPFAWTTLVGTLPLTAAAALLGARIDELSLTDPVLYLATVPFILLLFLARPLARRMRLSHEEDADESLVGPGGHTARRCPASSSARCCVTSGRRRRRSGSRPTPPARSRCSQARAQRSRSPAITTRSST